MLWHYCLSSNEDPIILCHADTIWRDYVFPLTPAASSFRFTTECSVHRNADKQVKSAMRKIVDDTLALNTLGNVPREKSYAALGRGMLAA